MKTPPVRGFCFPAIRQGYSRDALHQYPCHIVVLHTQSHMLQHSPRIFSDFFEDL
nr:MAG TPA: hypothetical protein [Caudoviricetes sp.]